MYTNWGTYLIGWPVVLTPLLNPHTVINFAKNSSFSEIDSRSKGQEVPRTFRRPKVHFHVHM